MGNGSKIYEVNNLVTWEKSRQVATNTQDACKQAGWLIGDCAVQLLPTKRDRSAGMGLRLLVKLPCRVCPYQYAECKKPDDAECPTRSELPEITDWLVQAAKAHLCPHVGEEITKTDYLLHQKWVPIPQAIEELTPKT